MRKYSHIPDRETAGTLTQASYPHPLLSEGARINNAHGQESTPRPLLRPAPFRSAFKSPTQVSTPRSKASLGTHAQGQGKQRYDNSRHACFDPNITTTSQLHSILRNVSLYMNECARAPRYDAAAFSTSANPWLPPFLMPLPPPTFNPIYGALRQSRKTPVCSVRLHANHMLRPAHHASPRWLIRLHLPPQLVLSRRLADCVLGRGPRRTRCHSLRQLLRTEQTDSEMPGRRRLRCDSSDGARQPRPGISSHLQATYGRDRIQQSVGATAARRGA